MYIVLIRLGLPQSALAFIFIGREVVPLLQVGLYKVSTNKTTPTRTKTGQTSLTGRPDWSDRLASELPNLAVNKIYLHLFFVFCKLNLKKFIYSQNLSYLT